MLALVTGASSGIGYDIAYELALRGYDLIIVARREERLNNLKDRLEKEFKIKVIVEPMDITNDKNIELLVSRYDNVDILINNAGFGICGFFNDINLETELDLIDLNIRTLHILTKSFLRKFKENNYGYILNVSSIASYMPGPKMATYYSSKSYVRTLTEAINYELKISKSNVKISVLCPGPTATEFDEVAKVNFRMGLTPSKKIARIAVNKMLKGKCVIIPEFKLKLMIFAMRFAPRNLVLKIVNRSQTKKIK